jgi:hypothetical protein
MIPHDVTEMVAVTLFAAIMLVTALVVFFPRQGIDPNVERLRAVWRMLHQ